MLTKYINEESIFSYRFMVHLFILLMKDYRYRRKLGLSNKISQSVISDISTIIHPLSQFKTIWNTILIFLVNSKFKANINIHRNYYISKSLIA